MSLLGLAVVVVGPVRSESAAGRDPGRDARRNRVIATTMHPALGAYVDGMGAVSPPVSTTQPAPSSPDPLVAPDALRAEVDGLPPVSRLSRAEVLVGEPAGAAGHWGVYEVGTNRVWIGPDAFASPERLRYVLAHEVGHAWYFRVATPDERARLNAAVTDTGQGASERVADCIAIQWGATISHYWPCPEPARAAVGTILAGG
ncbi:MAG: M1 family metallopeptidase [Actinobacteria bacterium]|nr:M1 family metallopeptidase [Actinomycetota bacterium]